MCCVSVALLWSNGSVHNERLANHTPSPCFSHLCCCTVPALSATPLEGMVELRATTYYRVPLPSHLSLESGALLVHMKLTITRGRAYLRVKEGVVPTQYVYTRAATGNTSSSTHPRIALRCGAKTVRVHSRCHWEYLERECRHSPERRAVRGCVLLARGTGLLQRIGTLSWKYLIICRACARVPVCRCGSESVCAHACLVLVGVACLTG